MHKRFLTARHLLLILATSLVIFSAPALLADSEAQQRQQLQQLNTDMQQLRQLLKDFKGKRSKLQTSLQKSEVTIGKLQNKIRKIQQQLKKQQRELSHLQQRRSTLNSSKQEQQKFIQQQVLAAYQVGQQKKLKILLNQEQPEKISRALTYYDYFNQARAEQINSYIAVIDELNSIEPEILEKTRTLSQAKKTLSHEHKNLLGRKQQRERNLSKINSTIKNKDQHLRKMKLDRSELEKLLAAVEQTLANIKIPNEYRPFTSLKGKLPWPVSGKPSNRFGSRRSGSSLRWQGLSIPAKEGSQVTAIHHGRIIFADWLRGSGLLLIVDHGDGYMSLYAHNQSLLKSTGEWINAGDTIATVGDSGGQNRASLYFEIRHNGKPTDPRRWCKRS